MALPSLPDDIIRTNILPRLGAKSVIRFRSVCKLWNSLILEPGFAKDHLRLTTRNPNDDSLIFDQNICGRGIAVLSLSDLSVSELLDAPNYSKVMLGSINGLVCVFLYKLGQFILWNPAIRQAMKINAPDRQFMSRDVPKSIFGFCWDAVENDYKVVNSYHKTGDFHSPLSLNVYSCNSGSWSPPRDSTITKVLWYCDKAPCMIVTGVPYWTNSWYSGRLLFFKFDFESKDFRLLPELRLDRDQHVIAVNLRERLSVLAYVDSLVDVHCFDERCGVWIKMYNVHVPGTVLGCFKFGGEIVFSANGKCRCYDHKTNKSTDLHNHKGRIRKCFSYKASLISLEGMKPQHQVEPTLMWK